MIRNLILTFALTVWSVTGFAQEIRYKADVKGMVCAYCAYSVSKNISALDGVDADSVDVDLKNGRVEFKSSKPVTQDKLKSLITEAGFNLVGLSKLETTPPKGAPQAFVLAIDMKLDGLEPAQYAAVLEAIANLAAGSRSRLLLRGPAALEEDLIKPVLMGRQQAMKVQFTASAKKAIQLQLFISPTGTK